MTPLELKSLLQAKRFESSYGKQIVLNNWQNMFFFFYNYFWIISIKKSYGQQL